MKAILLALVVVLSVASHGSLIRAPSTRSNLSVGFASTGSRLLYRNYVYRPAVPNYIQYQDLTYRGNFSTRISAIQATEVGYTQYASAWILSGGVNQNNVTVRIQSAMGYGYYYLIDIWGM